MTFSFPKALSAISMAAFLCIGTAYAQSGSDDDDDQPAPPAHGAKDQHKQPPAKEKSFEECVKDFQKLDGLFGIWRKKDEVRFELSPFQLGKTYLLQATRSTGAGSKGVVAGDPISDTFFTFRKDDDQIVLVTPNLGFRAPKNTPLERALKRSFPEGILASLKIDATHPLRKSMLIDMSQVFAGDIAEISESVKGLGAYSPDPSKTKILAVKDFPANVTIEVEYQFVSARGGKGGEMGGLDLGDDSTLADSRSFPMKVVYNLIELPETSYVPRIADDRVGYFTTDFMDFSDRTREDMTRRYIQRWDIRKKDPKAAMSEPVQPIVFWLDNGIPTEYRDAVRDGLLEWNKAFEAIGIKNAVVVKQMPDDADWDHADLRYNLVRWVTSSNEGYAEAQFRVNPITGQILNADITVDEGMVHATHLEFADIISPNTGADAPAKRRTRSLCSIGKGRRLEMALGALALDLGESPRADVSRDEYIKESLRLTIAHEMGHVLGLRHNFIASTAHTAQQLADPALTAKEGVCTSVMEYDPFNIWALKSKGEFWSSTIGPYDIWAIQYGYADVGALTPLGELPELKKIASRCNEPGLAYQTDENSDRWDPAVETWDLSADPLGYAAERLRLARDMMTKLEARKPKLTESYYQLTTAFAQTLGAVFASGERAQRYIGGLNADRNHRGDPGEKPALAPVPGDQQRQALKLLVDALFREDSVRLPADLLTKVGPDPNFDPFKALFKGGAGDDFPIRDILLAQQGSLMRRVFSDATARRVLSNEMKSPGGAFTLPELFGGFDQAIWSEVVAGRNVGTVRRGLQRAHEELLVQIALGASDQTPDDARALAWVNLVSLRDRLKKALADPASLDAYTKAHCEYALARAEKALNAQITQPASPAPLGGRILVTPAGP